MTHKLTSTQATKEKLASKTIFHSMKKLICKLNPMEISPIEVALEWLRTDTQVLLLDQRRHLGTIS
jgi:hypothetical protein